MLYRDAKNKKSQIVILTQLTGLSRYGIEKILEEGGCELANPNPELQEKIKELHSQGLSAEAIAKEVGLKSSSTVYYYFERLGLKPNKGGRPRKKEDKAVEEIKTVQPEVKQIQTEVLKNLKSETQKNYEELKEVLPKSIPNPEDMPINYDVIETLTPQQYYELAKMTIELLKTIWG